MRRTLARFDHRRLGRTDKGVVRACIGKVCGFSAAQTTRLIRRHAETGAVEDRRGRNSGRSFKAVYTPADVRLLAEMDGAAPFHACLLVFESIWAFGKGPTRRASAEARRAAVVGPFHAWPSGPLVSVVATVFPKS